LNNDVIARRDTLGELVKAYRRFGKAIYGSLQLRDEGAGDVLRGIYWEVGHAGEANFNRRLPIHDRQYDEFIRDSAEPRRVANLTGNSMLVPLSVVRNHGFIEEDFFLYAEELDYCLRLGQEGVPSILVPRSVVVHYGAASSEGEQELANMLWYYRARNRHIVARRYRSKRQYLFLLLSDAYKQVRLFIALARRDVRRVRRSQCHYFLLGLLDAFRGRMGERFVPEDFIAD
jgi:GT2 family glycosyltransferase